MSFDTVYTVTEFSVYKRISITEARKELAAMVADGSAEKFKQPSDSFYVYRVKGADFKFHDPFHLTDRPKAPRVDDVNAWMFGANISGTCYDPRI